MPLNCEKVKLGDVVSFQTGKLNSNAAMPDGEYPFFTCSPQTLRTNTYAFDTECVLLAGNNASGVYSIKYFVGKFDVYQRTYVIRALDDKRLSNRYLYYTLQLKLELFKNLSSGVTTKFLTLVILNQISLELPPLPTQRKISAILSAYDDLIENNLRRIKILEEMAQNLYIEWFVKFRFPGHEKVKMVDSTLGRIPEGWEVAEFRNLFEIKYGKTLPKTEFAEVGPYPVYGAGDVIGYYDKVLCQEKCALVTSRGNGSGTVWRTREAAFVTNNSLIILPKVEFKHWDYSFVELLLKHSNVMEAKTGSAQPQVTIENLNYVKAIVPERPYVEEFCSFVTPISEQVDVYLSENTNLRRTRDLLLTKLISGELDVSALDIKTGNDE